jgi:hypothetical protein
MSAVLEREVSPGIPQDGRKFEIPQQNRDNEKPRFVTILGTLIEPEMARDCPWMKFGGIQISNPCLRFVKNFVQKGRITPVLMDTYDWCTVDYWKKATGSDASYFERQIPAGYIPPLNEFNRPSVVQPMMGKAALPGIQIDSIINGSANVFKRSRRGVVEHKSLQGQDYNPEPLGDGIVADRAIWQIQKTIFPKYPFLPILFDETEQLLEDAKIHTYLRAIIDDDLESLNQIRDYARATVEQTHYTMRESAQKSESGYIPRYTDMDFVLLEQLGMARQDINIRKATVSAAAGDPELREMFKQFIQLQVEEKQAIADERAARVNGNTMAAAPIAQAPINEGYSGYPGQSGYSGFSGEVLESAPTTAQREAGEVDLDGPRPAEVHWKTWEKMQKERAGK